MNKIKIHVLMLILLSALPLCAQEQATVVFSEKNVSAQGRGVSARGNTATISSGGVYTVRGKSTDGQIIVDAPANANVELIFSGLELSSAKNSPVYCKQAKKLVITLARGSRNTLSDSSKYTFENAAKEEPDAALFSACDITIQGEGSLTVKGNFKHGIAGKDDIKITGGTFTLNSKKDAINADDVTISGGTFLIDAGDDAVHADKTLALTGGSFNIMNCYEGLEGTQINIGGGKFFINARNDAIGAAAGTKETKAFTGRGGNPGVAVHISGGEIEAVGSGDTVDSNGDIFVSGGTLKLSSPADPFYEGALLCNGTVHITGGNLALVGNIGVELEVGKQPVLVVSHSKTQKSGSLVSLRSKSGEVLLEVAARKDFKQSIFSSPALKTGETYSLYINGKKISDIRLTSTLTKAADDGGKFTGGYPRGHW